MSAAWWPQHGLNKKWLERRSKERHFSEKSAEYLLKRDGKVANNLRELTAPKQAKRVSSIANQSCNNRYLRNLRYLSLADQVFSILLARSSHLSTQHQQSVKAR